MPSIIMEVFTMEEEGKRVSIGVTSSFPALELNDLFIDFGHAYPVPTIDKPIPCNKGLNIYLLVVLLFSSETLPAWTRREREKTK